MEMMVQTFNIYKQSLNFIVSRDKVPVFLPLLCNSTKRMSVEEYVAYFIVVNTSPRAACEEWISYGPLQSQEKANEMVTNFRGVDQCAHVVRQQTSHKEVTWRKWIR